MSCNFGDVIIFTGNSNPGLVNEICKHLKVEPGVCEAKTFSDGEIEIEIGVSVRGKDVYVIQSTSNPVNDNLMEMLIIMDALKRA